MTYAGAVCSLQSLFPDFRSLVSTPEKDSLSPAPLPVPSTQTLITFHRNYDDDDNYRNTSTWNTVHTSSHETCIAKNRPV